MTHRVYAKQTWWKCRYLNIIMLSLPISTVQVIQTLLIIWNLLTVLHSLLVIKKCWQISKQFLEIWFCFSIHVHLDCLFLKLQVELVSLFPLEKSSKETDWFWQYSQNKKYLVYKNPFGYKNLFVPQQIAGLQKQLDKCTYQKDLCTEHYKN